MRTLLLTSILVLLCVSCQPATRVTVSETATTVVVLPLVSPLNSPLPTATPVPGTKVPPAPPATATPSGAQVPAVTQALDDVGLIWRECETTSERYRSPDAAQSCYGRPAPGADPRRGVKSEQGSRLQIGADLYETRHQGEWQNWTATLYKNGEPVKSLTGTFGVYDPDISLWNVADEAAWEFADPNQATIVYGGQDLRDVYQIGGAYAPYDLAGKLIFVSMTDGKYQVMYDGKPVGPKYDSVLIAYCCEESAYSIRQGEGRYTFRGERGDKFYLVEIEAKP